MRPCVDLATAQQPDAGQFLAALVTSSDDAIIGASLTGVISFWNEGAERLFGYKAAEVLGRNATLLRAPDKSEELVDIMRRLQRGETVRHFETERLTKDGRSFHVSLTVSPVIGPGGEIAGMSAIGRDMTQDYESIEALRRSQRSADEALSMLEVLQNSAPVGIGFMNRQFRHVRINEALASVNGASVQEHLGRTVAEVVPALWPRIEPLFRRVLEEGEAVLNVELSGETAAEPGRLHHWLANYYPVRVGNEIVGIGVITVDITDRMETEEELKAIIGASVSAVAAAVEVRDPYTAGHERRVAVIASAIAAEMGLEPFAIEGIDIAARIHDIGKIGVPAEILTRPGSLSATERDLVESHCIVGADIVRGIKFPWAISDMIEQHHERLDGSGYPRGLREDEINLGARIIAIADVVEAMASHRPYRPAKGIDAALEEIAAGQGRLFDSSAVEACLKLFREGRLCLTAP